MSVATSSEKRIWDSGASPGEGRVETTSPTSRIAPEISDRPSSNAMISKVASTSARFRPRRTFSRSRCSSYSVSARSSESSRSSPSNSSGLGLLVDGAVDALDEARDLISVLRLEIGRAEVDEQRGEELDRVVEEIDRG